MTPAPARSTLGPEPGPSGKERTMASRRWFVVGGAPLVALAVAAGCGSPSSPSSRRFDHRGVDVVLGRRHRDRDEVAPNVLNLQSARQVPDGGHQGPSAEDRRLQHAQDRGPDDERVLLLGIEGDPRRQQHGRQVVRARHAQAHWSRASSHALGTGVTNGKPCSPRRWTTDPPVAAPRADPDREYPPGARTRRRGPCRP